MVHGVVINIQRLIRARVTQSIILVLQQRTIINIGAIGTVGRKADDLKTRKLMALLTNNTHANLLVPRCRTVISKIDLVEPIQSMAVRVNGVITTGGPTALRPRTHTRLEAKQ